MRTLGIDYGSKRIGLAISDESGMLAFPYRIVNNTSRALATITKICEEEGIAAIVIGESLNAQGRDNAITEFARAFGKDLAEASSVPVHFMYEGFSSFEAARTAYIAKPVANPRRTKIASGAHDDKAAAIILQRYLDTQRK